MLQSRLMKIAKNRKRLSARKRGAGSRRTASGNAGRKQLGKRKEVADEVRLYIEDKGITRPQLEKMVKRSESTMNHFFAGDFSDALLTRVEHVLDRKFRRSSGIAPTEWGKYTQEGSAKFAGSYLTLRNDFDDASQICAYVTTIEWGKIELAHMFDGRIIQAPKVDGYGLIFREERRIDTKFTHRGQVWFPGGQLLYLVTAYGDGRLRAAIASVPDDGRMSGIQISLYNPRGPAFVPAASPITFLLREKIEDGELGRISSGHPFYESYKQAMATALEDVVFALPAQV